MEATEFRNLVKQWCTRYSRAVLLDQHEDNLLDVYSNRSLMIPANTVEKAIERTNPDTKGSYIVILKDSGHQVVLSEPGIAWAPVNVAQVPMDQMPEVVCWRDFESAVHVIEHHLTHHPDEAPSREILMSVMFCTAVLAGARLIGFDVDGPERDLEVLLEAIEKKLTESC